MLFGATTRVGTIERPESPLDLTRYLNLTIIGIINCSIMRAFLYIASADYPNTVGKLNVLLFVIVCSCHGLAYLFII